MEEQKNNGYEIISRITTGTGFNTVLGHKPTAMNGYQYVTWTENNRGFDCGHYFGTIQEARLDLIVRGAREFSLDLDHIYSEKHTLEDIEAVLQSLVKESDVEKLMKDKSFLSRAYHEILKIDYEYDAVVCAIEKIITSKYF